MSKLEGLPLFTGIGAEEFKKISLLFSMEKITEGDTIFREGDTSDSFYVVISGAVDIVKTTPSGREKLIANMTAGDFFGEMSLFDEGLRSASAVAVEDVEVAVMPGDEIKKLFGAGDSAAARLMFNILRVVSVRMRKTDAELTVLYETGIIIGSTSDLNILLSEILDVIVSSLGAGSGIVFLKNDGTGDYDVNTVSGTKKLSAESYSPTGGILGEVVRLKGTVSVPSLKESPVYSKESPAGYESDSMLAAPLISSDVTFGVVLLGGKVFDRGDEGLLTAVGSLLSVAVSNILSQQESLSKQKLNRRYFHL